MAIPDYQTCMLPFLSYLADGGEHSLRETEEALAEQFGLTSAERAELLPSGQQGVFKNRIGWAKKWSRSFEQLSPVAKRDHRGYAACICANGNAAKYASSGVAWLCA